MGHASDPFPAGVREAMRSLAIDGVTAEVAAALDRTGVTFVLLKGPVTAQWLYSGESRSYGDTDLLVPARSERRAEAVLHTLGFRADPGTGWVDPGVARNHVWIRESAIVELHVTLTGIEVAPADVWENLSQDAGTMSVRGQTVRILALPARLLHVALHAAQHGPGFSRPLRDLELACAAHGIEDWRPAAALAARLDAIQAFSAGLDLAPDGRAIRRALELPDASDPTVLLRARSASPVALGVARFAGETPRGRARQVLRVLLPTPAFLRWWTPLARRGRRGLVAAYVWRYAYLAGTLPGAIRTFSRARRSP